RSCPGPNGGKLRPGGDLSVQAEQRLDRLRRPAPQTAFGRNAEPGHDPAGGGDPVARALETVGEVDEAEVQLRLRVQPQPAQRREVGVVAAAAGHREVEPANW